MRQSQHDAPERLLGPSGGVPAHLGDDGRTFWLAVMDEYKIADAPGLPAPGPAFPIGRRWLTLT